MFRFLRIHTVPKEEEGSTWLQLFFDLVYVAILVELGVQLSQNLNIVGVITFVIIFIPIWWSWMEYVDYGRRYPIDDIGQRILTVLYMAVMLLLAFNIHSLTELGPTTFILIYGASKFVLALMYGRAWIYYPEFRHQSSQQGWAFLIAGIIWIVFAFFAPDNPLLFALAVVLGALLPLFIRSMRQIISRSDLPDPPVKYHFTLHRFGELTIIVLGELFIKLVTSSAGRELTAINYIMGAGILAISVSLWWLYFDHLEHANLAKTRSRIWIWAYSHFPYIVAITAYGVMGNHLFAAAPDVPLDDGPRLLFTSALATAVLAFSIIEYASKEKDEPLARSHQPWIRLIVVAALLAVGFLGGGLTAGWLVMVVAAILLLQVALDVTARSQRPEPEMARSVV